MNVTERAEAYELLEELPLGQAGIVSCTSDGMIGNLASVFPASVSRPMASILVVGTTRSAGLNWSDAPAFAWVWVDIWNYLCLLWLADFYPHSAQEAALPSDSDTHLAPFLF